MKNVIITSLFLLLCSQLLMGQNKLVACYDLNNNANDAINQLNGQMQNTAAVSGHNSIANSALLFRGDSSSYVILPDNNLLHLDTMSVSLWVNTNDVSVSQYLFFHRNNAFLDFEAFAVSITSGKFRLSRFPNSAPIDSRTSIQTNTWYHLAYINRGDSLFAYVNGVLEGSTKSYGSTEYMPNRSFVLGGTNDSFYNLPFNGKMDNLRIYSKALNASEVRELYTQDPTCDGKTTALKDLSSLVFSISPNPTNGQLNIQLADGDIAQSSFIFNNSGQLVYQKTNCTASQPLNVEHLKDGFYAAKITQNGRFKTQKLVILH